MHHGAINVGLLTDGPRALLIDYGDGDVHDTLDELGVRGHDLVLSARRRARRIALQPDAVFGLALDVGTTTVVGHLVDLTSGTTREAAAKYNSQIKYGADVISRINSSRSPGGADR